MRVTLLFVDCVVATVHGWFIIAFEWPRFTSFVALPSLCNFLRLTYHVKADSLKCTTSPAAPKQAPSPKRPMHGTYQVRLRHHSDVLDVPYSLHEALMF